MAAASPAPATATSTPPVSTTPIVAPRPPPLGEQHRNALPTIKAALAEREAKTGAGQFPPFPGLPKDTIVVVFNYVSVKDLCTLRRTCRAMERYLAHLPLRLRIPRYFNAYQTHICLLLFPATRIVQFELLPKMNIDAWKFMFSVLTNPVFELKNVTYDVLLDKAGRDLFTLGRYRQALQCFDRALEISQSDEVLVHNRGVCLLELGQFSEALSCFDQSLKAAPNDNRTKSRRAQCLSRLGRLDEALTELDAILKAGPDALSYYRRALTYQAMGKHKEALDDFAKSTDELKDPAVYRARAESLKAVGDKQAADAQEALAVAAEQERDALPVPVPARTS